MLLKDSHNLGMKFYMFYMTLIVLSRFIKNMLSAYAKKITTTVQIRSNYLGPSESGFSTMAGLNASLFLSFL